MFSLVTRLCTAQHKFLPYLAPDQPSPSCPPPVFTILKLISTERSGRQTIMKFKLPKKTKQSLISK